MGLDRREFIKSASAIAMVGMFPSLLLLDKANKSKEEIVRGDSILRMNSEDISIINSIGVDRLPIAQIDITSLEDFSYKDFIDRSKIHKSEINMNLVSTTKAMSILKDGSVSDKPQSFELITKIALKDAQFDFEGYITHIQYSAEEIVMGVMISSSIAVMTLEFGKVERNILDITKTWRMDR